jgi:protein TonB
MASHTLRPEYFDNPWRRLRWTAPASVVAWALILGTFIWLINEPVVRPEAPEVIDAELIEEPPPAAKAEPEPPKPAPMKPSQPQLQPRTTTTPPAVETPVDSTPPTPAAPTASIPPTPPKENTAVATDSNARAIYRPTPTIPDDLRDEAFSAAALARFDVAADGSVTVVLVKPMQNPRLNRLLLESLKTWRFFPQLKDGKPVPSSQEIVVHFEVK